MDLLKYVNARLGESGTHAALCGLLAVAHAYVDPGLWSQLTLWGAVLTGVLGIILKEGGQKPTQVVISDALAEFVSQVKAMPPIQTPNNGANTP